MLKATCPNQLEAGVSSRFAHLRPFYGIAENNLRDHPIVHFPYAFNQTVIIDEVLKMVDLMRYDDTIIWLL